MSEYPQNTPPATLQIDRWSLLHGLAAHTLADNWHARPVEAFREGHYAEDNGAWLDIAVPAHWQQHPDLAEYAGRLLYRCFFAAPPWPADSAQPATRRAWLRFNGVFYWSQPFLNGAALPRHEGYFQPHEYDVSHLLRHDAPNSLLVEVECPNERNKFNKRMITGVFSHWDCLDPHANPGGIWLPVELLYTGPVRIQGARCHTESFNDDFAQLRYTVDVDAAQAGPVLLRWTITPRTFAGSVQVFEQRRTLRQGQQHIAGLLKLRDPRLWWTHDLGNPDLYTITLELLSEGVPSDQYAFIYGVRRFEMHNWIPHLNGVRFLIKGNNYPPGDMRLATMNSQRYEHDLQLACDCHMNFLRMHAHIEHPALYHAADAAGILLWQDMPLQWLYRAEVLSQAQQQARQMVRLLYNHPCVAMWCMHNEPIFLADTTDERLSVRLRTYSTTFGFSWNRDVMDARLKRIVEEEDQQRPVLRASGDFYIPYLRAGGDAHAYFGWYSSYGSLLDLERLIRYLLPNLRFVTEFGAQSFPNLESCTRFMPADMADIDFAHLAERHSFQGEIMRRWLPWHDAASLADLVDMTQDYQAYLNRFYIDRLRYYKYRPTGGIVPFLFVDPYPAVLWSIIDYWRVPKRAYYAMRMAFSPQYAFSLVSSRSFRIAQPIDLPIYAVNDAQHPALDLQLAVYLRNPEGEELARVEHPLALDADCQAQEIDHLRLTPTMRGRYTLQIVLTGGESEVDHVYPIEVS
jgi:beta-mannosidase